MAETHVYKTAGACEIRLDLHRVADDAPAPTLVWIHGGALIVGSRNGLPARQRDAFLAAGWTVASIDYRLAPETKLPAIAEDLEDAFRWLRQRAPSHGVDGERLAVVGHSAGGYLTLLSGHRVTPRPRALVSFYGYGDIFGPWYAAPSEFYRRQPLVSDAEAGAAVGDVEVSQGSGERGRFYLWCRQNGRWPQEVVGHDPRTEPEAFTPYCPERHVDAAYPPTLLLHGTADTDVPYERSVAMAAALERAGVAHELITVPDGPHGFDGRLDAAEYAALLDRVVRFLRPHLR